MQHKFKKSALAICISLLSQGGYAQSAHQDINLTEEIAKQYTGKGVKLGVVDGGFILNHRNLDINKITPLKFEMTTPAGGVEFFDPKENILVDNGEESGFGLFSFHGGAVSGLINGIKDSLPLEEGTPAFAGGVAPNSHLVIASIEPYKKDAGFKSDVQIVDLFGKKPAEIYDLEKNAKAITKVAEQGVFAINNSWGMGGVEQFNDEKDAYYVAQAKSEHGQSNALVNAIRNAVKKHNTLFAFATGNAAPATENEPNKQGEANPDVMSLLPRYFPELEKNYLAVGAATKEGIETFSHRCGYAKNWCITAPGNLFSLMMLSNPETGEPINYIESLQGTSFSTPVVTGSLGVLKERFNYMTSTQVRDTLLTTAKDLGDNGVDDVYGWGLVDLVKAVNGPAQLLGDETYTVTKNDTWRNTINSAQYKLTKQGANTLTFEGETHLKEIQVDQGRLNLNAATTAPTIRNHAELGVATTLASHIIGADNSTTHFASNAHWKMPANTTLGNVSMEEGSQITLNPAHSKANGNLENVTKFNTLTIYNDLNGKGQFNFVSRLANNESDNVVVNGIATGDFTLQVENTGAEPNSPQQLDLVKLDRPSESTVSFSLANHVDLGAYRYELAKSTDNRRYYLYNPKKEQELAEEKLKVLATQAEIISRYSNTALSDVSVQVNNLLSLGKTLDQRLFEKTPFINVWSNVEGLASKQSSDNYRAYEQRSHIAQVGVQSALNANSDLGIVISQVNTTAEFDHEGKSKARLNSINAFVKNDLDNVVSQFELGVSKSQDRISVGNTVADLRRNSLNVGFLLGYNWEADGFKLQPSVGLRYHRLARANYLLDNAEVKAKLSHLFAYQAGVKAGKTFNLDNLAITPSLASYYVAMSAKDNVISVNGRKLTQKYGDQFHHEVSLGTAWKNWEVSAKAGVKTGKELHRQRYWGVNFGYNW